MPELNGRTLLLITVGGLVTWTAATGRKPATMLRNFITGQPPSDSAILPISGESVDSQSVSSSTVGSGNAATNRATGRILAARYGWVGAEWTALDKLWTQESSWSNVAQNSSGAYGIPQALPPTKLPAAGRPPSLGGRSDVFSQINWGLSYIQSVYGSPSAAWTHEVSAGWY